ALLAMLEEQSQQAVALDDPGNWARQALGRVRDWVGLGQEATSGSLAALTGGKDPHKSRVGHALHMAATNGAEFWGQQLPPSACELLAPSGRRLAAGEAAYTWLLRHCEQAVAVHRTRLEQQATRAHETWSNLERALENCLAGGGGFNFFGS